MVEKTRKPLEDWQKRDAERLLELWRNAKARSPKTWLSQEAFASKYEIGSTQGAIWQYLHGRIPLNLRVALKFARGLGCELVDISPTLAAELEQSQQTKAGEPGSRYNLSSADIDAILRRFEKLSPAQRTAVLDEIDQTVLRSRRRTADEVSRLRRRLEKASS